MLLGNSCAKTKDHRHPPKIYLHPNCLTPIHSQKNTLIPTIQDIPLTTPTHHQQIIHLPHAHPKYTTI